MKTRLCDKAGEIPEWPNTRPLPDEHVHHVARAQGESTQARRALMVALAIVLFTISIVGAIGLWTVLDLMKEGVP